MSGLTPPPQPEKSPAHSRTFTLKTQRGNLEAGVGIEPASTALQAAA